MNLLNCNCLLFKEINKQSVLFLDYYDFDTDKELDLRKPDEAAYYFSDCAGEAGFLPVEESNVILYDEMGEAV